MTLIIVQGASGTGKTTLVARLTKDLQQPTFLKDAHIEARYDQLGKKPNLKQWVQIENGSWQELYRKIRETAAADGVLIIEGNFKSKQRKEIAKLLPANAQVIEIFCFAKGLLPFKRYVQRNRSGERHPGHLDQFWYSAVFIETVIAQLGLKTYKPLRLSDDVLEIDTSDFTRVDYQHIVDYISAKIGKIKK